MAKTGKLSINSENMLPIIKRWLYSDHDIFMREQIANASDAITKLKKLEGVGEFKPEGTYDYKIRVEIDPDEKTLKIIDNGIGMTEDEVVENITQIAFSGATKFLEKYKDLSDGDQIIGHFGLGFYSAFMVADEVHIDTLSYMDGAKPIHWESDGSTEYTIEEGDKKDIGTEITLFLNDDCLEFCNEFRVREVLTKYCSFMPVPIFLEVTGPTAEKKKADEEKRLAEENEKAAKEAKDKGEEAPEPKTMPVPEPINDIHPLWTKQPSECTDEEYKAFYRKVFNDYREPLFWIHLNTDYPFNLKGILYFPRLTNEYEAVEAEIKLYNNQVFIADNIKEAVPEFLLTMKGVIDCPDLPLNVSRSALQNDGSVKKINEYISRKTADKLKSLCNTKREEYEGCWDNIGPFLKYGCLKDNKFADRMVDYMLYKDLDGKYYTMKEYLDKVFPKAEEETADDKKEENTAEVVDENGKEIASEEKKEDEDKEPEKKTIYYVTDPVKQATYVNMFKSREKSALLLEHRIDSAYVEMLERRDQTLRFARIDSDIADDMKSDEEVSAEDKDQLTEIFRKNIGNDKLEINVVHMTDADTAAVMTLSEESRRMQDMMKLYGMDTMDGSSFGIQEVLTLNASHPLVQFVLQHKRASAVPVICKQLYDLAVLSHKPLSAEEMDAFVKRSNEIMMLLTK